MRLVTLGFVAVATVIAMCLYRRKSRRAFSWKGSWLPAGPGSPEIIANVVAASRASRTVPQEDFEAVMGLLQYESPWPYLRDARVLAALTAMVPAMNEGQLNEVYDVAESRLLCGHDTPDGLVRLYAAGLSARLRDPRALPHLQRLLSHKDRKVRSWARRARRAILLPVADLSAPSSHKSLLYVQRSQRSS